MSPAPIDPEPESVLAPKKLWGSGPNRIPAGDQILGSLLVGCTAHVVLIVAFAMMVTLLDEFTTRKQEFCFLFSGLVFFPLVWWWHWSRNAGWRWKDGLELQHRGPTALILVLPFAWLFLLWHVVFGAVRP